MYKRWMSEAVTLAVILFVSASLLLYGNVQGKNIADVSESQRYFFELYGDRGVSLVGCLRECQEIRINSWEKDGQEWLFLPAFFRGKEVDCGGCDVILKDGLQIIRVVDQVSKEEREVECQILFGSEISFAYLTTESGTVEKLKESDSAKESGYMCMISPDGSVDYAGNLSKVKIRGNSTRFQPKIPFRIQLSEPASLAGLGNSRDYVMLAEYGDISLMQNRCALELANRTTDCYEPDGAYIDLYVNGEYVGIYLLCEGVILGENRLDIADLEYETALLNGGNLKWSEPFSQQDGEHTEKKGYEIVNNPEDISGGYLLELEYSGRYEGEENTGFRTDRDWALVIKEPGYASREQVDYIKEVFQRVENAMYAPDWIDADSGQPLEDLVDLESFVHKYLVDEICLNTDLWTSQFLYKARNDDRIYFGPVWDFDMAFGHYDMGYAANEFYANYHIWYEAVYTCPEFRDLMTEEYKERYLPVLQELANERLDEWRDLLQDSARMNFTKWDIGEIYVRNSIINTGESFEECVDSLKEFLKQRTEFLNREWLENPVGFSGHFMHNFLFSCYTYTKGILR